MRELSILLIKVNIIFFLFIMYHHKWKSQVDLSVVKISEPFLLLYPSIYIMHSHCMYLINTGKTFSCDPKKNIYNYCVEKHLISYLLHFGIKYITHTLIGLLIFQLFYFHLSIIPRGCSTST